jgi:hypothetical protein
VTSATFIESHLDRMTPEQRETVFTTAHDIWEQHARNFANPPTLERCFAEAVEQLML